MLFHSFSKDFFLTNQEEATFGTFKNFGIPFPFWHLPLGHLPLGRLAFCPLPIGQLPFGHLPFDHLLFVQSSVRKNIRHSQKQANALAYFVEEAEKKFYNIGTSSTGGRSTTIPPSLSSEEHRLRRSSSSSSSSGNVRSSCKKAR
jgi:hypothetical protein